jgi:hypothetical protein
MKSATLKVNVAPFSGVHHAEIQETAVADDLLNLAQGADREQRALMETATAEQVSYQERLEIYLQTKHDQVENIEDKLENLIVHQQAQLQQSETNRPGLLTLANTKQKWVARQSQQQTRLQVLHNRLDFVRELKVGMGMHSPKLEALAERKLRKHDPTLAQEWDASLEAHRKHQALLRKQDQEKKRTEKVGVGLSVSLSPIKLNFR